VILFLQLLDLILRRGIKGDRKVGKLKPQEYIGEFRDLLLDKDTHNILVRGYFDDDKLFLTFGCL
jgi:hypothetical protein